MRIWMALLMGLTAWQLGAREPQKAAPAEPATPAPNETVPPPAPATPDALLGELKDRAATVSRCFADLEATYPAGEHAIAADVLGPLSPVPPRYHRELSGLFIEKTQGFDRVFGRNFVEIELNLSKSPRALTASAGSLLDAWTANAGGDELSEKFFGVHSAYWRTVAASYIYIEYLKRLHYYDRSPAPLGRDERAAFEASVRKLDFEVQGLMVLMHSVRRDPRFDALSPQKHVPHVWEETYAPYYHFAQKDFDILRIGPVRELSTYLVAADYPRLPAGLKAVAFPPPSLPPAEGEPPAPQPERVTPARPEPQIEKPRLEGPVLNPPMQETETLPAPSRGEPPPLREN